MEQLITRVNMARPALPLPTMEYFHSLFRLKPLSHYELINLFSVPISSARILHRRLHSETAPQAHPQALHLQFQLQLRPLDQRPSVLRKEIVIPLPALQSLVLMLPKTRTQELLYAVQSGWLRCLGYCRIGRNFTPSTQKTEKLEAN